MIDEMVPAVWIAGMVSTVSLVGNAMVLFEIKAYKASMIFFVGGILMFTLGIAARKDGVWRRFYAKLGVKV